MDIAEAFARVAELPREERLLIAVLLNDPPRWSAGNINDAGVWFGFGSAVVRAIEEYRNGDMLPTVSITTFGRGHTLVAMGHDTVQALEDALKEGIRALGERGG
ncbi:hypothetical protein BKK79_06330 [Cupriavidus sp. USMAA2-4]|uniref:hypothetical protein n=1 Tax=Cupriavidus sp. USMAA2-4 TaxID=876364 RepID=UPI0008A70951|nr:hypothetical protein [Cupriavidus sp. USMAA2-4]AOY91474.1 hypothetical protein BKK79_06330 [Cupriavidus sp. USMAA2-4]